MDKRKSNKIKFMKRVSYGSYDSMIFFQKMSLHAKSIIRGRMKSLFEAVLTFYAQEVVAEIFNKTLLQNYLSYHYHLSLLCR